VYGIEESDFPDVIEAEGCHQDTRDSVEIESEAFLSASSPQHSSPFISESGTDISLAQEVSKNYLVSRYSDSRHSESLLAVAPDDILPVRPGDILSVQGPHQTPLPVQLQPLYLDDSLLLQLHQENLILLYHTLPDYYHIQSLLNL
jgi:hypothetical protein